MNGLYGGRLTLNPLPPQSPLRRSTVAEPSKVNDTKKPHSRKAGKKIKLNDELAISQAVQHCLRQGSIPMALQRAFGILTGSQRA